jgi:hypothetical protein
MTDLRTAAQQALEALEQMVVGTEYEVAVEAERVMDALRAALAEPVQEPVAWAWETSHELAPQDAFSWVQTAIHKMPLYTAPPQRKPLTEEEIERITSNLMTSGDGYLRFSVSLLDFARAIEAALKERNA